MAGLAALYSALLDDLGLENVTVIGNSVSGWIDAEMALLGRSLFSGIVLLDAVGIEVEGHPVAAVSGLSGPRFRHVRSTTRRPSVSIPRPFPTPIKRSLLPTAQPRPPTPALPRWPTPRCSAASVASPSDPGVVGRERPDCRAGPRPGLCRCHPRGALRGAAGHRAHAPDGDPRTGSAGDLDRRGVEVLSDGAHAAG